MVDDYIGSIKKAGFVDIKIIDEVHFSVKTFSGDPILKSIIEETGISENELRETEGSIASVKVFAQKPLPTS